MAEHDNTAERELLQAIEGLGDLGSTATPNSGSDQSAVPGGAAGDMGTNIKSRLSFFSSKFSGEDSVLNLSIQDVNKIVTGFVLFFGLWLCLTLAKGLIDLGNMPKFKVSPFGVGEDNQVERTILLNTIEFYDNTLLGRNIFKAIEKKHIESVRVSSKVGNMAKNLKVTGLSWTPGDDNRYAMIEDTRSGVTHYLEEGDPILIFNVHKILEDSVIVRHKDKEEIEIR
jgi:hypothetical protein